jgi:hypothetical protein
MANQAVSTSCAFFLSPLAYLVIAFFLAGAGLLFG